MSQPDDTFTRATSIIADFASPFYAEERQRDVWNEASALGFQSMIWAGVILAGAMTWIGGRPLLGWAIALLAIIAVSSWLTLLHANRRGVSGRESARLNRPRMYLFLALYLGTLVGMVVRAGSDLEPSTIGGAVLGAAAVLGAIALNERRKKQGE